MSLNLKIEDNMLTNFVFVRAFRIEIRFLNTSEPALPILLPGCELFPNSLWLLELVVLLIWLELLSSILSFISSPQDSSLILVASSLCSFTTLKIGSFNIKTEG